MKKLILLIVVSVNFIFTICAQNSYNYPIKPGSEKWNAFTTHQEMIDACQIPQDTLDRISTQKLFLSIVTYPLLGDIFFFNNMQLGFDELKTNFSGMREFLKRKDIASIVFDYYNEIDPLLMNENSTISNKELSLFQICSIEMLCAQKEVLEQLSVQQKKEMAQVVINKLNKKISNQKVYGLFSYTTSLLIIARIMEFENFNEFNKIKENNIVCKTFIEKANMVDSKLLSDIYSAANQYISN